MFERFDVQTRVVIVEAQAEARDLNHRHLGTEHLLLGLVTVEQRSGPALIAAAGGRYRALLDTVTAYLPPGDAGHSGPWPFTPRSNRVLQHAVRAADELGDDLVGLRHLLLGLLAEPDGIAAQALDATGINQDALAASARGWLPPSS